MKAKKFRLSARVRLLDKKTTRVRMHLGILLLLTMAACLAFVKTDTKVPSQNVALFLCIAWAGAMMHKTHEFEKTLAKKKEGATGN